MFNPQNAIFSISIFMEIIVKQTSPDVCITSGLGQLALQAVQSSLNLLFIQGSIRNET